jgi:hypothetical protein
MATYPAYIPAKDADFANWMANFATLLTADPDAYGLDAADAATVQPVADAFAVAYPISQDPITRTPVTVAAKDAARASAEAVTRPYAVRISQNAGVDDADKAAIGVTVRTQVSTPIPAPVDAPTLGFLKAIPLQFQGTYEVAGAEGKSKPFGSTGMEVAVAVGVAHTVDPQAATVVKTVTKSPFRIDFTAEQQGQKLTIFARFNTTSGPGGEAQKGPWSAPLQTVVI